MIVLKIAVVFAVIMIAFHFKRPLWQSMLIGAAAILLLFWMNPLVLVDAVKNTCASYTTWQLILAMIFITFLQRILEKREQLKLAVDSMNGLFQDRRINAAVASACLGMLPSAAVVTVAGEIIDDTAGDSLTNEEKATCATYFRHIPESFVPTFTVILLGCSLSGISISQFLLAFFPMVIALFVLGFFFYLRKIPKHNAELSGKKSEHLLNLFKSLWSILLIILLIMAFNMDVVLAVLIVCVLALIVYKVNWGEIVTFAKNSVDITLLLGIFTVFLFMNVMGRAGIIAALPDLFSKLPLPAWLTFALLFFVGSIVAGSQAVIAAFIPLAFSTVANAGVPLFVLLMGMTYAAMQLSPTHVCVAIAAEYFHVTMGDVFKKTAPIIACFFVILVGYYLLLGLFL